MFLRTGRQSCDRTEWQDSPANFARGRPGPQTRLPRWRTKNMFFKNWTPKLRENRMAELPVDFARGRPGPQTRLPRWRTENIFFKDWTPKLRENRMAELPITVMRVCSDFLNLLKIRLLKGLIFEIWAGYNPSTAAVPTIS